MEDFLRAGVFQLSVITVFFPAHLKGPVQGTSAAMGQSSWGDATGGKITGQGGWCGCGLFSKEW